MELIDKVERLQNTIYSSEQANMIDKLKEKGLITNACLIYSILTGS